MPGVERPPIGDELFGQAMSSNAFVTLDPWYEATGFRTTQLTHANQRAAGARPAAEFLLNTRLIRGDAETSISVEDYFGDGSIGMLSMRGREPRGAIDRVALPDGPQVWLALGDVVARRRSTRMYTGDPVALAAIATMIRGVVGTTADATVQLLAGGEATLHYRATPSGGGLYPNDLCVAALAVDGLDRGVYKVAPVEEALLQVGDAGDLASLLRAFAAPEDLISLSRAAAVFLIVGHPSRSTRKYGGRGVRLMLLEAGAMAEHLNLFAVALGLGAVDCAAYYDDEIDAALGLDGVGQMVLHSVIVGEPA